jgi:hypothetical protein
MDIVPLVNMAFPKSFGRDDLTEEAGEQMTITGTGTTTILPVLKLNFSWHRKLLSG